MNVKVSELSTVLETIATMSKENMARSIVHELYRNTSFIEELYSSQKKMDMSMFKPVKRTIQEGLEKHMTVYPMINPDVSVTSNNVMDAYGLKGMHIISRYIILLLSNTMFGQDWDNPTLVSDDDQSVLAQNLINANESEYAELFAIFLLSGKFRDHCMNGSVMTNDIMEEINKDVYNRMYTILDQFFVPFFA